MSKTLEEEGEGPEEMGSSSRMMLDWSSGMKWACLNSNLKQDQMPSKDPYKIKY